MESRQDQVFDLSRASDDFYSRGARIFLLAAGLVIILVSIPLIVPDSLQLLRGTPLPYDRSAVYLAIVLVAYPAVAFLLWGALFGAAPRPIRMTLGTDSVVLEGRNGRRSEIKWAAPRFKMVLLDQSKHAFATGGDASLGFRIDGLIVFRAVLTRQAFDALIAEARVRGCVITSSPAGRWSVSASTPGTVVYLIQGS